MFVALLYTSDSDKIYRYRDEVRSYSLIADNTNAHAEQVETVELCKWQVDLSSLPSFQQNASNPHPNGFFTGNVDSFGYSNKADEAS